MHQENTSKPRVYSSETPYVIEQDGRGERVYDIFSRLLKDRIIFIRGGINDRVADIVVAQLLFLDMEDSKHDISIYINSPGGDIYSGLAIYDTMQFIKADVATTCIGSAMSLAAILLAAGTPGKRFMLPHSRVLLHQPLMDGLSGQASDIEIHAAEIRNLKEMLAEIISKHTGKSRKDVLKDSDRDFFLSAEAAKDYGIVDEVIIPREKETDE
ncbi:MAG: ATP-dependent Clp protease proteolytic subunit [Planctomycetota bacterium]|nr:MAG: ATP-dependent Clp protease proteolytic subunit [Planctomycetota bacterium]